jgi:hypothetical protein
MTPALPTLMVMLFFAGEIARLMADPRSAPETTTS